MKKVILFDLDDTLYDEFSATTESLITVSKQAQEKFNINTEELYKIVKTKARELWHQMPTYQYCLNIGISSWEGLWGKFIGEDENLQKMHSLIEEYQINSWHNALLEFNVDDKEFAKKLSQKFNQIRRKKHRLFPESLGLLKLLSQNYRLGLLTNGAPDLQREKIKGVEEIAPFFEHIFVSGEVGIGKPNKKIFLFAVDKFDVEVDDVLMVGNSLTSDVQGANNAGMKVVWINLNGDEVGDGVWVDGEIRDLSQLAEELKKLGF